MGGWCCSRVAISIGQPCRWAFLQDDPERIQPFYAMSLCLGQLSISRSAYYLQKVERPSLTAFASVFCGRTLDSINLEMLCGLMTCQAKLCQTQVFRNICLFWHQPACPSSSFHDSAEQTERTQLKLAETTVRKVEIRTRTKAEPMSGTSNGMDKYWEHMWWGTHLKLGVRISEDWSILFHFLGYARVCWGILTRLCLVLWWTTFNIFQPPENWRPLQCFMDKAGLCARRSSGLLASCICISWDFAGNMFI